MVAGPEHTIECGNVYEDVLHLYKQGEILGEYPIKIEFLDEHHGPGCTERHVLCILGESIQ